MQGLIWLVTFLLVVVFAILLLTMLPYHYCLQGVWREIFCAKIYIKVGLFNWPRYSCKISKKDTDKNQHKKRHSTIKKALSLLKVDYCEELWKTVKRVMGHSLPKTLEIRGRLGFSDPYYTGLFAAVSSIFPSIFVTPVFTEPIRDITFHIEGRVIPFSILCEVLKFIFLYLRRRFQRWVKRIFSFPGKIKSSGT